MEIKGSKVLVVEDGNFDRQFLVELLKEEGVKEVFTARNGLEGQEIILKNEDLDLVISDYNMDKLDGMQLLEWLRKNVNSKINKILFIMITAAPPYDRIYGKAKEIGASDVLFKPFRSQSLIDAINDL